MISPSDFPIFPATVSRLPGQVLGEVREEHGPGVAPELQGLVHFAPAAGYGHVPPHSWMVFLRGNPSKMDDDYYD